MSRDEVGMKPITADDIKSLTDALKVGVEDTFIIDTMPPLTFDPVALSTFGKGYRLIPKKPAKDSRLTVSGSAFKFLKEVADPTHPNHKVILTDARAHLTDLLAFRKQKLEETNKISKLINEAEELVNFQQALELL